MKYARRGWRALFCGGLVAVLLSLPAVHPDALAADPSGAQTFTEDIEGVKTAINFSWTLMAAFLVFFMQAGFAMLGAGLIRTKNTANYLAKSYLDFSAGALAFWAIGFALMFGGSGAAPGLESGNWFMGTSGFFLSGAAYDVTTFEIWIFQMVFAATAATIVAGSMAERTKFHAYVVYSFIVVALIYPIYGHWVWGGGWLSELGAVDFAGSGVVHAVGGFVALAGAIMVGPRTGKFNPDGTANTIPGANLSLVVLGTFCLFFGWFGFNAGSTLAATDLRISVIATNTFLAGSAGAVAATYMTSWTTGKVNVATLCNGSLAGLVGITAPCAYVPAWAAVVIGLVAGVLVVLSVSFIENVLKVDDPVGAISVHGTNGLWGLIAVGIFADGTYGVEGLLAGSGKQLVAQLISCAVVFAWAFGLGLILFWIIKVVMGLRVSREEEETGLDLVEHGQEAYPAAATR